MIQLCLLLLLLPHMGVCSPAAYVEGQAPTSILKYGSAWDNVGCDATWLLIIVRPRSKSKREKHTLWKTETGACWADAGQQQPLCVPWKTIAAVSLH